MTWTPPDEVVERVRSALTQAAYHNLMRWLGADEADVLARAAVENCMPEVLEALETVYQYQREQVGWNAWRCSWCGNVVEATGHADDCPFALLSKYGWRGC